jgi:hypothetical protein
MAPIEGSSVYWYNPIYRYSIPNYRQLSVYRLNWQLKQVGVDPRTLYVEQLR